MALPFRSTTDTTEHAARPGAGVGTSTGSRYPSHAVAGGPASPHWPCRSWRRSRGSRGASSRCRSTPLPIAVVALELLGVAAGALVALQFARSATVAPDAVRDARSGPALRARGRRRRRAPSRRRPPPGRPRRRARRAADRPPSQRRLRDRRRADRRSRAGSAWWSARSPASCSGSHPHRGRRWRRCSPRRSGSPGCRSRTCCSAGGRVRPGDRVRWTYSSLGEAVVRDDVDGVAPATGSARSPRSSLVNLAVALRGMSDRWTHGLPPMPDAERVVAMVVRADASCSARCSPSRRTEAPELDNAHLVARRLEERTARQSATRCDASASAWSGSSPGSSPGASTPLTTMPAGSNTSSMTMPSPERSMSVDLVGSPMGDEPAVPMRNQIPPRFGTRSSVAPEVADERPDHARVRRPPASDRPRAAAMSRSTGDGAFDHLRRTVRTRAGGGARPTSPGQRCLDLIGGHPSHSPACGLAQPGGRRRVPRAPVRRPMIARRVDRPASGRSPRSTSNDTRRPASAHAVSIACSRPSVGQGRIGGALPALDRVPFALAVAQQQHAHARAGVRPDI